MDTVDPFELPPDFLRTHSQETLKRMQLPTFLTWMKICGTLRYTFGQQLGYVTQRMASIICDVAMERGRQVLKWGDQSHPCVRSETAPKSGWEPAYLQRQALADEQTAKMLCQRAFAQGTGTWEHIAREELAEAIAAPNREQRRQELVQTIAVLVAWIEDIDKKARL